MRLNLRHGNDKIGFKDGTGQPQGLHSGVAREQAPFEELVTIQVHERNPLLVELVRKPALDENEFRVPLVPRTFADEHGLGAETTESLSGGTNKKRVCVDVVPGNVINEVRFDEN